MDFRFSHGTGANMENDVNQSASHDREIRILEIQAGIKKVIYGTMIVGVSVAFFPFAQETSRAWFDLLTSERTDATKRETEYRAFLESLKEESRSKNLEDRIVLAEFYAMVSPDIEARTLWREFLNDLIRQRSELREKQIAKETTSLTARNASPEEVAAALAAREVEQLETSAAAGGYTPVAAESLRDLLVQLESANPATRRTARSALARMGIGLVRPAMTELLAPDVSYRLRLGLVVALTEMLRENKRERATIILVIEPAALAELLRLATDPDRTIRVYAGEFLFDLGDPRVFELVQNVWNSTESDDGRFNLALAMKGAAPFVPREQVGAARFLISGNLGVVGPKTDELLNEAMRLLP